MLKSNTSIFNPLNDEKKFPFKKKKEAILKVRRAIYKTFNYKTLFAILIP